MRHLSVLAQSPSLPANLRLRHQQSHQHRLNRRLQQGQIKQHQRHKRTTRNWLTNEKLTTNTANLLFKRGMTLRFSGRILRKRKSHRQNCANLNWITLRGLVRQGATLRRKAILRHSLKSPDFLMHRKPKNPPLLIPASFRLHQLNRRLQQGQIKAHPNRIHL